jgi:hypothetical protein
LCCNIWIAILEISFNNESTMLRGPLLHGYWNGMKPAMYDLCQLATDLGCITPPHMIANITGLKNRQFFLPHSLLLSSCFTFCWPCIWSFAKDLLLLLYTHLSKQELPFSSKWTYMSILSTSHTSFLHSVIKCVLWAHAK